ncbi:MAG: bifunctional DNA-formamidopyrimidine glycosylase/DNA-(apurinic or apyrimidinic site) lyase [Betaproteobacteria bacterium]|nr:bifunctional DNA-formamidopyrimidine glycosylase/DNA-(apurinic or apyrimidinic site) lyase [Betaproteobacteria bacterium]MDE2422726.1 bifunctional DNA-formamidopyrimidine glycosylase/DNA-(apurinic or apyrimidinic site) lyase [Betaproteobacteria bacterium]
MPELPEVEVTRLSLLPHVLNRRIDHAQVLIPKLRYPIDPTLSQRITGATITRIERRSKYLTITTSQGSLMVHLGMTGTLTIKPLDAPLLKHDHAHFSIGEHSLRFNDPRRFGALLWAEPGNEENLFHPLLKKLGIEPFDPLFTGEYLWQHARQRQQAIKPLLLSGDIVVGVGNIYASEALFKAGILPQRSAKRIAKERYQRLALAIQDTLQQAITLGGSTLRDFQHGIEQNGYFQIHHQVYDREQQPCHHCQSPIRRIRQAQRSTFYCPQCQR